MSYMIDLFTTIFNRIVNILDTLKLPGSSSLLMYMLGAIILGFILKIVKGSTNEFSNSLNTSNSTIINTAASKYVFTQERKRQLIEQAKYKPKFFTNYNLIINNSNSKYRNNRIVPRWVRENNDKGYLTDEELADLERKLIS